MHVLHQGTLNSIGRCCLLACTSILLAVSPPCQAAAGDAAPAGSPLSSTTRYQFAIYYLGTPAASPRSALQDQLKRTPHAPALVATIDAPPKAAVVLADDNTQVQKSYAPPSLKMIQYFGRGLSLDQANALQRSERALVLDFAHPSSSSLTAYRTSLQLTEQVARQTKGLIWDEDTREVFTPEEWHKRRLDTWDGDTPDVLKHTVIHAYQGDKLVRAITLGMGKFGLPDVVVEDFPWSANHQMGNLVNLLAQALVEGSIVGEQGRVDLDLKAIRHAAMRQSQLSTLKPNATAKAPITLVQGVHEKGDPDNRLLEIRFDHIQGRDQYARQEALLNGLFGYEDAIARVKHNDQLLDASRAAKARLPALRKAFNEGLQPGEFVMVKAPFETASGGREWMWVEVTAWNGDDITGLLKNEPADVPGLHGGQMVKVSQPDIFDYLRRDAKGRSEGNETGRIIERMQARGP